MTIEQLSFVGLPRLAISEGATTPNPGVAGCFAWSTSIGAMMRWSGTTWNALASGAPSDLNALSDVTISGVAANDNLTYNGSQWVNTPTQTINDLTEDTAPDGEADFLLFWDTSAAASEKLKPRNLFKNSSLIGSIISPAALSANTNDWAPTGLANASIIRVDASTTVKITGITGGEAGRVLMITNVSTATDGDVILTYEDALSTAANRIAGDSDVILEAGSGGALLVYDGTSSRWRVVSVRRKYTGTAFRHTPFYATDFLGAATADTGESSYAIWDLSLIGTGPAQAKIASEPTHPGILQITSGTTANSGGFIRSAVDSIRFGGGEVAEFVFRAPAVFTTATGRIGFIDTATSADCVDGAYFEFSTNGNLVGKTSNNSTRTTSATVATMSASTWYRLRIVVNRAATAVDFYVYDDAGNLLGTQQNTTNIPTAAGRETGHGMILTSSGTSAVALGQVDYMSLEFTKALI